MVSVASGGTVGASGGPRRASTAPYGRGHRTAARTERGRQNLLSPRLRFGGEGTGPVQPLVERPMTAP